MSIRCKMKYIIHPSEVVPCKRFLHIIRDEHQMRIINIFAESPHCLLFAAPQSIYSTVQFRSQILLHDHINKEASQQACGTGQHDTCIPQFFPWQFQPADIADIIHIQFVVIQIHKLHPSISASCLYLT